VETRCCTVKVENSYRKHLNSFKKDRRKDKFLATMGWVVLRVTYSEVTNDMIGVLNTIKKTIPHRIEGEAVIKPVGFVHNKLYSWVKI
jgi:very-short-patch-repair endonuclease